MNTGEEFSLGESHAILRYLADTRGVPDHWYPADPRKRAQVDMYLDQHHSFLRVGLSHSFLTLINPKVTGKPLAVAAFKQFQSVLKRTLTSLETRLPKNAYICGPERTIADLSAACELDQGKWAAHDLSGYPKVKDWLERMIDQDPVNFDLAAKLRKSAKITNDWLTKQQGYPKL